MVDGYEYEIKEWINSFGSVPISEIARVDFDTYYSTDNAQVFELENGSFAMVVEEGCSCYSSSDAYIEIFQAREHALKALVGWRDSHEYATLESERWPSDFCAGIKPTRA